MRAALAAVLVLAIILRLLFVLSDHGDVIPPDGELYSNIAIHILEGDGYIQDARSYYIIAPPAYPTFLALAYAATGLENSLAVQIAQIVMSVLTVLIVYRMGSDLAGGAAGLVGAILISIHWVSIHYVGFVLTETLFTFFTALLTWLFLRSLRSPDNKRLSIVLGLVWGISCLCRPHFLFFFPIAILVFGVLKRRIGIRAIVATTVVAFLVITPWVAYISIQQGRLIPVASYGGLNLWIGNSGFTNPNVYYNSKLYTNNLEFLETRAEAEILESEAQDAFYQRKVARFIAQEPLRFTYNTWRKWLLFWRPVDSPMNIQTVLGGVVGRLSDQLLIVLGMICACILLALRCSRQAAILLWVMILYYSGLVSINNIVSTGRYRLPIMPIMAAIIGAGIVLGLRALFQLWRKYRTART
jgi:4-amino-4-deoxy-L-arabinose transferase-like glycosyltransferase